MVADPTHGANHTGARTRYTKSHRRDRPRGWSCWWDCVARAGIEPATFHFSGGRSYRLSYLASNERPDPAPSFDGAEPGRRLATPTGLEPATSAVTGRRANQLRYGALRKQGLLLMPFRYPERSVQNRVPPTGFEPVLPP